MREFHQVAIEALLDEVLGGRRPPDLRTRIAEAVARQGERAPARRPGRWRAAAIGALLGTAAAAAVLALLAGGEPATEAPTLAVRVARGELSWTGRGDRELRLAAGATANLVPRVGDAVVTAADTEIELVGLGLLRARPASQWRIMDTHAKHFAGGTAIGAITVSVVAGAITWFGGGAPVAATAGEQLELRAHDEADGEPLRHELASARERIAELEQQLARRPADEAPAAPVPAPAATEAEVPPPLVIDGADPALTAALGDVDWRVVGRAIDDYLAAHRDIADRMARGEDVPMQVQAETDRAEGELFTQLGPVLDAGLPGMSFTAKVHHPLLFGNMLDAVLRAAGQPFDDTQRQALRDLMAQCGHEDALRRTAYRDDTPDLQRFVDEIELQERFMAGARARMSPEQLRVIAHDHGDRAGFDPFGSGFQWSKWTAPVTVPDRNALAERATAGYASDLGLDDGQRAGLARLVRDWADAVPGEWFDRPADALDRRGKLHVERVRAAARQQMALQRAIAEQLGLSSEQRERLARLHRVFVPVRG